LKINFQFSTIKVFSPKFAGNMKNMMGKMWIIIFLAFFYSCVGKNKEAVVHEERDSVYRTAPDILEDDVRYHISLLASDSLEGRKAGSAGERKAGEYIKNKFAGWGLGKFSGDYDHPFSFLPRMKAIEGTLFIDGVEAVYRKDFIPIVPVDSSNVSAEVIFAGFGYKYSDKQLVLDDYADIDVRNKWLMLFEESSLPDAHPRLKQNLLNRYEMAKKKGASGILAIHTDKASGGALVNRNFSYSSADYTIPVIRISQKTADSLLNRANAPANDNVYQYIPVNVSASVYTRQDSIHSNNIIACLEGQDPVLKDEYIVIGAHHDHLGIVKTYTVFDEKQFIYNGADDNASGVAGILEIAEKLASGGEPLKRSVIFMTFGAEEEGLKGSRHLCENLPVPASKIKLMVNLDMIGRLDSWKLFINTVDSGAPAEKTVKTLSAPYTDLRLIFSPNKMRNSDHYPFYEKNIPVVMFTTGLHKDYHTPRDTAGTLNYAGEKYLLDLVYDLIVHAALKVEN
jgi:hypothetical protein